MKAFIWHHVLAHGRQHEVTAILQRHVMHLSSTARLAAAGFCCHCQIITTGDKLAISTSICA